MLENRESFEHRLAGILADSPGTQSAVLLVGMDRFKEINETLDAGTRDQVLQLVGERLRSTLRGEDMAFRLSQEEFAVLLHPVLLEQDVCAIASRITGLLQRAYLIQGQIVDVSASIGVILAPGNGNDPDVLLKRASIALRAARASGPGAVQVFEAPMEDRMVARHALTLDLRKALPLRQFELHYQPQVDLVSQRLTGFEALLRWRHPELGWVPPGEFIPIAEETGMIGMIGEWVLRTACQQATQLPEDLVIAVNASPLQFRNPKFVDSVERTLASASITARRIEIEITEGVLIRNGNAVVAMLEDLRKLGVWIAMDDFGSGYSSLGQLAKLPFDTIKIDRSLVGGSTKQRAIVRAIATLGEGLGMSILAEGIETEEELAKVRADGCILGQGYLFGKAVPSRELAGVLERLHSNTCTPTELQRA